MNSPKKYMIDINKYLNIKQIHNSKHGSVYLIQNEDTKKYYAAKVINCEDNEIAGQKSIDFLITSLIRLHHSTIIQYYSFSFKDFDNNDNIALIMDFSKNGSLANYIERIRITNKEIFYNNTSRQKILIGIVRGMAYLHSHNISNIDLTPNNILLDDDYHPLITNYGLYQLYQELNLSNEIKTSYNDLIYTPPELLAGKSYNDKSEVYSFGIIMYEIITESIAFPKFKRGEVTESDFINKVINENYRPTFNTSIKPSLKNLIEKCWSSDPESRPSFEYLFKKLAYNSEEGNSNESDDDKYFLDDVEKDEIISYTNMINGNDTISVEKQQLQNQSRNKKSVTISRFNSLPIKSQQIITSKIINDKSNKSDDQSLRDLSNLLLFLLQFECDDTSCYVDIPNQNEDEILDGEVNSIRLHSIATETLHRSNALNSSELIKNIKQFSEKKIELKYPSESFSEVYKIVSEIQKNQVNDLKIEIFITGVLKTDDILANKTNIDSITIDSSVKTIGMNSFSGMLSLTHITIPQSVQIIEEGAFQGCSSLTKIDIPHSVVEIGDRAFYECTKLTEIKIPNTVTTLGKTVFYMCSSLKSIRIPESITVIDDGTFVECISLSKVELPPKLITIGSCCFSKCSSLKTIKLPDSITSISKGAFYACSSLNEVIIPPLVTEIGDHEFQECTSLQKVILPKGIKVINNCAFCKCSALEELVIPNSVESIGKGVFYDCTSLKNVNFPSSVKIIELSTFQSCISLTKFIIPSSVTEIGGSAFRDCESLAKITIPSSVTEIGVGAFYNCMSLSEISIPSSVLSIKANTFQGCKAMMKIVISNSVKEIGDRAFKGCSSVCQLTIPSSVSSIGECAFIECASLKKVSIPSSITYLGKQAFPAKTVLILK